MVSVDTSMYPSSQPQSNPLQMMGQATGIANAISENKLMQQEILGRQAIGSAIQKNTGPDGVVNINNALSDISQDPNGSWLYMKLMQENTSANAPTEYMSTNAQGQPVQAKAPLYKVPGLYAPQQNSSGQSTDNSLNPPQDEQTRGSPPTSIPPQGNPVGAQNQLTSAGQPQATPSPPPTNQLTGQTAPQQGQTAQVTPQQVAMAQTHLQKMKALVAPLATNPNVSMSDVNNAVADLGADPDVQMNHVQGAAFLADIAKKYPMGATSQQINQEAQKQLQMIDQIQQNIAQKFPQGAQNAGGSVGPAPTVGAAPPVATAMNPAQPQPQPSPSPSPQMQPKVAQVPVANPTQLAAGQPGVATGLPAGYAQNQSTSLDHYTAVQNAANSVPQENAALNNILNISKTGAKSGTLVGKVYSALAGTGLVPTGVSDAGAQLQLIQSHAAQLATAGGMPGSDARLQALENAKVSDANLPQVIQAMIPYLKAVNNGKVLQAGYYRQVAGNGQNPDQVNNARATWNSAFDPRILEMREMQNDPAALKQYVSTLQGPDKTKLMAQYNALFGKMQPNGTRSGGILGQ